MVSSFLYHMFTGIQRVIDQLRQLGVKYHFAAAKRLLASRKREAMINHLLAAGALSERLGRPEMMTSAARMLMRLGIFERAWQLNCASVKYIRGSPLPEWDGGDLSGRTILIWPHGGHIGKSIRCSRFIAPVAGRAQRCIVLAEQRMVPILRRTFESVDVRIRGVNDSEALAEADVVASFETLGFHLAKTKEDLARCYVPLRADPALVASFRKLYASETAGSLVGISWWSSSGKKDLPSTKSWSPLLNRDLTTFVSLQYEYSEIVPDLKTLQEIARGRIIHDRSVNQLVNLDRFAAQVAALDAVVTVSNTTIHVAGDFGIPAILIRDDSFYGIWPLSGPTPWYPSVTIVYKNGRPWPTVFAEAREQLDHLLSARVGKPPNHLAPTTL
jgi:hypothetical protein